MKYKFTRTVDHRFLHHKNGKLTKTFWLGGRRGIRTSEEFDYFHLGQLKKRVERLEYLHVIRYEIGRIKESEKWEAIQKHKTKS